MVTGTQKHHSKIILSGEHGLDFLPSLFTKEKNWGIV